MPDLVVGLTPDTSTGSPRELRVSNPGDGKAGGITHVLLVNPDGTSVLASGVISVVDKALALVAAGTVDCTSAAALNHSTTGAGYITVTNLDTVTVYLGGSGVTGSTNGEALPSGASRTWYSADLTQEYGIGSATVNSSIRR